MTDETHDEQQEGPKIGRDEWVARSGSNVERGRIGRFVDRFEQLPPVVRYGALILPLTLYPAVANTDYLLQVGVDTLIYVLLALGLNVAVGWAGLLDLGYIAFFGFGAYGYALLGSGQFDVHLQAQWAIPLVVAGTVILGFLLGLPSRRLSGDYLAIVTLFFFQVFLTLLNNADRLNIPGLGAQDITGGPNGISDIDPFTFFGYTLTTVTQYYYVAVVAIAVVMTALYLVNHSRTGRAWRAMREDELAAEVMSMPVDWLKLLAFAFGAGVAGLTGTILAAQQGAVFPVNFDLTILITLYAMVILGGTGSLGGVAIGAIVLNVSLEVLRTPSNASLLFFLGLLLVLLLVVRPWWKVVAVLAATVVFGLVVHAIVSAAWPAGVDGATAGGTRLDTLAGHWVILPADSQTWNRIMYVVLVAGVLWLTVLKGWKRLVALVPVLYLAVCIWESAMLPQPAVARYILIGAMLVGMMAVRPQGLFGSQRVEIV
jgi:branched-chain amino acid transport system permease protein